MHIETVILHGEDLSQHIETIEFFDGPPQYMVDAKPSYSLSQTRFTLDSLNLIYKQMRACQEDSSLIDVQTFQSIILVNMQSCVLPNVWRYVPFDAVIMLASRLEAKPLTDTPGGSSQVKLFRRRSLSLDGPGTERSFMNWRKAFMIFVLMAGRLPCSADLQSYESRLRAQLAVSFNGLLSKNSFIKVSKTKALC